MLKKQQRITDSKDFQTIYRRGRHYSNAFFSLNYSKNYYGHTRVGIVVNKKVAKKATERNLLKRQLREIVKKDYDKLAVGMDIIISTRPKTKELDFTQLEKEIVALFATAKLIK
ncbi:MAG: ribonuclease P protein component [Patescibacteria group bacterium]